MTIFAVAMGVLAVSWLGFSTFSLVLNSVHSKALSKELAQTQSTIGHLQKQAIPKTKKTTAQDPSLLFQTAFVQSAHRAGCEIGEYALSPDRQAYSSNYSQELLPAKDVMMVKTTLKGSFPKLISTLESLRDFDGLFEVDSVEIVRSAVDAKGTATVTAQLSIRLIVDKGA